MKDLYKILGVDKSIDDSALKKAYRKLAMKHHPDKGGDEKKFKEFLDKQAEELNKDGVSDSVPDDKREEIPESK